MPISYTPNSEWEAPVITGGTPATPTRMNNLEDGLAAVIGAYNALETGDTTIGAATASDGDVLTFDTVTGWGAAAPTGGGGGATDLDDLTDVDVSTVAPTDGQSLVFDTADGLWKPATVSGGGGGAVDSVNGQTGTVVLNQDDIGDGATYKQYSAAEKTKLSGIASGATANDTDSNLKNRANHTGTQLASTVSDFASASRAAVQRESTFSYGPTLTVGTGAFRLYNRSGVTRTISLVTASVGTQPTGAAVIVDVNLNGTTIFTTQSNRPQIAVSTNEDVSGTPDVTSWADGDYLTIDIDQIGSTAAGAALSVSVVWS